MDRMLTCLNKYKWRGGDDGILSNQTILTGISESYGNRFILNKEKS